MKKKILIYILVSLTCLLLVGCKKEEKKANDWILNLNEKDGTVSEEDERIFNDAIGNYSDKELKPVALLGEQVVAGMNYMYLCKNDNSFKVAIVYKNLDGKSQITQVSDFNVNKYVNKNIELKNENLSGGWNTIIPGKPIFLDEKMQTIFDNVVKKIVGVSYYPITVLAHQEKSGTNYAVLCYGRISNQNDTQGVYVLTINVDEHNIQEIVSIANINLADYNK